MQFLKNFTEKNGKKKVQALFLMLLAGVLLLVVSAYFASTGGDGEGFSVLEIEGFGNEELGIRNEEFRESVAAYLSRQLEEILSLVAGAGQVRVMLTMGNSSSVYAQNSQVSLSTTVEDDGDGGSRNIDSETSSLNFVMVRMADGSERPLRLQEVRPAIEGVMIVAQGAGDVAVRDALIRGAATVLGIGVHQVQVFQKVTQ